MRVGFKSSTISVWFLMCDLSFGNVSFMNVGVIVFGAYMFRIETSSWIFFCDDYEMSFINSFDYFEVCFDRY